MRTPDTRYVFRSHDQNELYDPHEQASRAGDPAYQALRQRLRRPPGG